MKFATTISPAVRAVLEQSVITDVSLRLPGQLDRKDYVAVDKVLKAAGGKWNRATGSHVWPTGVDPREVLGLAFETGGIVDVRKALQQFFTPPDLAERMASVVWMGDTVLEPSAGSGSLAIAAAKRGAMVTCVEIDERLAHDLAAMPGFIVKNADFLSLDPVDYPQFDAVLMNPPFEGKRDIAHVTHALRFLRTGGVLRAIMAAGIAFREDKDITALREYVQTGGGELIPLPNSSFQSEGTNVQTVMINMRKP